MEDTEMMEVRRSQFLCTIPLALITVVLCQFAYGKVIYVDDNAAGANDGSSWADAYCFLQNALADARFGDEIRVAQGIYKPDQTVFITKRGSKVESSGDRTETFQLINGVAIKGGYAGLGELNPDVRDVNLYESILSGDLDGDDIGNMDDPSRNENSLHVVTGSWTDTTAVLDGFTITAGYANGFGNPNDSGGGMYSTSGSPTIVNCTFKENAAVYAGGMANRDICSPTLINCMFIGNSVHSGGAGIYDWHSSSTLVNCSFSGNFGREGAAMRVYHGNSSLTNCSFSGNFARERGGALYVNLGSITLTNCTLSDNSAGAFHGGGIYNRDDSSSVYLSNCILWNNSDSDGISESAQIYGGTPVVNYCCIQGWTGTWGGFGNMGADPMFAYDPDDGGDGWGVGNKPEFGDLLSIGRNDDFGDLHLRSQAGRWDTNSQSWIQDEVTSPCIDAGENSAIPQSVVVDLDGNPRIINDIVDLGAYEVGMALTPPAPLPLAFNPDPADGATYVSENVELSWSSGSGAQLHIVYFGDNFEDVNNDAGGLLLEATTYKPGPLESNKVYYWRVDEYDGVVIHKGDVWSFTVADSLSEALDTDLN